jgi:hypothetical protein
MLTQVSQRGVVKAFIYMLQLRADGQCREGGGDSR